MEVTCTAKYSPLRQRYLSPAIICSWCLPDLPGNEDFLSAFITLRVTPELYNEVQLSYAVHRVSPVRSTSVRHGSSCYKALCSVHTFQEVGRNIVLPGKLKECKKARVRAAPSYQSCRFLFTGQGLSEHGMWHLDTRDELPRGCSGSSPNRPCKRTTGCARNLSSSENQKGFLTPSSAAQLGCQHLAFPDGVTNESVQSQAASHPSVVPMGPAAEQVSVFTSSASANGHRSWLSDCTSSKPCLEASRAGLEGCLSMHIGVSPKVCKIGLVSLISSFASSAASLLHVPQVTQQMPLLKSLPMLPLNLQERTIYYNLHGNVSLYTRGWLALLLQSNVRLQTHRRVLRKRTSQPLNQKLR